MARGTLFAMQQSMKKIGDIVREERKRLGWSQAVLAEKSGVSQQAIGEIERHRSQNPTKLVEIANALNVSPNFLKGLSDNRLSNPVVPLVGYATGGGAMILRDQSGGPIEYVPAAPGTSATAQAVRVQGDSMSPAVRDGWLIYFSGEPCDPSTLRKNAPYVVWLMDGRCMLKYVRPGTAPNKFHLHSESSEPIFDAEVRQFARVEAIVPQ